MSLKRKSRRKAKRILTCSHFVGDILTRTDICSVIEPSMDVKSELIAVKFEYLRE